MENEKVDILMNGKLELDGNAVARPTFPINHSSNNIQILNKQSNITSARTFDKPKP